MTDTATLEQLVVEKLQAQQQVQVLMNVIGAMVLEHGKTNKSGQMEYRIPKAVQNKLNGQAIDAHTLKPGTIVITVSKQAND